MLGDDNRPCPSTKRRYASKAKAKKACKNTSHRAQQPGPTRRLIPYRCPHCDDWHLTKRDDYNAHERVSGRRRYDGEVPREE